MRRPTGATRYAILFAAAVTVAAGLLGVSLTFGRGSLGQGTDVGLPTDVGFVPGDFNWPAEQARPPASIPETPELTTPAAPSQAPTAAEAPAAQLPSAGTGIDAGVAVPAAIIALLVLGGALMAAGGLLRTVRWSWYR